MDDMTFARLAVGLLCGLVLAAAPVDAAASINVLERKIADVNATFVQDHPSEWGPKAEAIIAARLLKTQHDWERYRGLRCHTLTGVSGANQGAACVFEQTQLRLAELTNRPDAQFEAAVDKIKGICQDGSALDQSFCYSDYMSKRESRVTAFVANYKRLHGQRAGSALANVYRQWRAYAEGACFRDDYSAAPMHSSSQRASQEYCLLLLSLADLSFIDGWQVPAGK